jgi:hypothetical protein
LAPQTDRLAEDLDAFVAEHRHCGELDGGVTDDAEARVLWRARRAPRGRSNGPGMTADRRRSLLVAALGFTLVESRAPELAPVHRWLDTWSGIGLITEGMARQDYDLQLTRYDARGWRATFYVTGMEHSPTAATGSAWEQTAPRAVQTGGVGCAGAE